ncbi:MAG: hypothetical protein ACREBU_18805 [Nitrososphaera sp.]
MSRLVDLNDDIVMLRKEKFMEEVRQRRIIEKNPKFVSTVAQRTRDEINRIINAVTDSYTRSKEYKDTIYKELARPALFWPDGTSLGFGYASHVMGGAQKFYRVFEYWGFKDLTEFYSLPMKYRNRFLIEAKLFWEELFGENSSEIRKWIIGFKIGELTLDQLLETLTEKECTLRSGYCFLAGLFKEQASKESGWSPEESRGKAEADFRRAVKQDGMDYWISPG